METTLTPYRRRLTPWVVSRQLDSGTAIALKRFRKQQDAIDYVNSLKQFSPNRDFTATYDP